MASYKGRPSALVDADLAALILESPQGSKFQWNKQKIQYIVKGFFETHQGDGFQIALWLHKRIEWIASNAPACADWNITRKEMEGMDCITGLFESLLNRYDGNKDYSITTKSSEKDELSLVIEHTPFQSKYHHSVRYLNEASGRSYTRHVIDVTNEIIINGLSFKTVYQTGLSTSYGQGTPSPKLELSLVNGTHSMLAWLQMQNLKQYFLKGSAGISEDQLTAISKSLFEYGVVIRGKKDVKALSTILEDNVEGLGWDGHDFISEDELTFQTNT